MTQRQISHDFDLPTCADGHTARHVLDMRGAHAGGGHFIECMCRATVRTTDFDAALGDWYRINGRRRPRELRDREASPRQANPATAEPALPAGSLLQFPLPLRSAKR